jgi:thioredoxin 1
MEKVNEKQCKEIISTCTCPVIVDFSASWCMPCKALKSTLDELSANYVAHAKFINCDAEECTGLTEEYGIMNVPTVLFFKDGNLVDRFTGALPKSKIIEKIEAIL